jgi:hypothetical protein
MRGITVFFILVVVAAVLAAVAVGTYYFFRRKRDISTRDSYPSPSYQWHDLDTDPADTQTTADAPILPSNCLSISSCPCSQPSCTQDPCTFCRRALSFQCSLATSWDAKSDTAVLGSHTTFLCSQATFLCSQTTFPNSRTSFPSYSHA